MTYVAITEFRSMETCSWLYSFALQVRDFHASRGLINSAYLKVNQGRLVRLGLTFALV